MIRKIKCQGGFFLLANISDTPVSVCAVFQINIVSKQVLLVGKAFREPKFMSKNYKAKINIKNIRNVEGYERPLKSSKSNEKSNAPNCTYITTEAMTTVYLH